MSQQRAKSSNDSEQNPPNANNTIINLDDSDTQFVGILRPAIPTIDLCVSPSTSAAAAAAAAAPIMTTPTNAAAGESLKSATIEAAIANVASGAETSASPTAAALECPICLQTCIHPARLPCGHIFCFLCVKGVAYKNRRCAMCRREIPAAFLDHPQLVNGIDDICATRATEDGYQWYYEGRNGGWWAYDSRTNDDIETAFKAYEAYKIAHPPVKPKIPPAARAVDSNKPRCTCDCPHTDSMPNYDNFRNNNQRANTSDNIPIEDDENVADYFECFEYLIDLPSANDLSKFQVSICGKLYIIDLIQMTQTLRSMAIKKRKITRRKSSNPGIYVIGVAGINRN